MEEMAASLKWFGERVELALALGSRVNVVLLLLPIPSLMSAGLIGDGREHRDSRPMGCICVPAINRFDLHNNRRHAWENGIGGVGYTSLKSWWMGATRELTHNA